MHHFVYFVFIYYLVPETPFPSLCQTMRLPLVVKFGNAGKRYSCDNFSEHHSAVNHVILQTPGMHNYTQYLKCVASGR